MEAEAYKNALRLADLAVAHAQVTRKAHAKRAVRTNKNRQLDIHEALVRLKRTMAPIRSELARIPYELRTQDAAGEILIVAHLQYQREELLDMSARIQRERRKLWKMQDRKGGKHGKR